MNLICIRRWSQTLGKTLCGRILGMNGPLSESFKNFQSVSRTATRDRYCPDCYRLATEAL